MFLIKRGSYSGVDVPRKIPGLYVSSCPSRSICALVFHNRRVGLGIVGQEIVAWQTEACQQDQAQKR